MKNMMIALVALLAIATKGNAMSYEQARNEALFLTDKMAYELNLNEQQYEAAYEINLDYLMGVTSYDDVYGTYWERRNLDLSYILLDWQWNAFCAASYFYRPLYWRDGFWHFGIYARYPHRDYFYFGRPTFYATYRGGHAWHHIGGRGYYYGRRDHFRPVGGRSHFGMLDRWNRGDYRHHQGGIGRDHGRPGYGGGRNSSTRTTVDGRNHGSGYNHGGRPGYTNGSGGYNNGNRGHNGGSFGGTRDHNSYRGNGSFGGQRSVGVSNSYSGQRSLGSRATTPRQSYEGSRASFGGSRSSSSYRSSGSSSYRSSGSSYGSSRSSSYSRSGSYSGGSRGGSSYSGGHSSGSFGGGHSSGGHSSGGGRSFGGHR